MRFPSDQFDEAVSKACDGRLEDLEAKELRELLLNDADAMDQYLALTNVHADLASDPRIALACELGSADPSQRFLTPGIIRIAASLVVLFGFGYWVLTLPTNDGNNEQPEHHVVAYSDHIKPIFKTHCFKCHGASKQKGGLRLDQISAIEMGGESGVPVMIVGDSGMSEIIQRLRSHDPEKKMPSKGKSLSSKEVELIATWIDTGARWSEH